jgi:hypothetical protein
VKAKQNVITIYDEAVQNLQAELRNFFNTTEYTGIEISEATKLSRQTISDIKAFLNEKSPKNFSSEKIKDVLVDLYKANMIK